MKKGGVQLVLLASVLFIFSASQAMACFGCFKKQVPPAGERPISMPSSSGMAPELTMPGLVVDLIALNYTGRLFKDDQFDELLFPLSKLRGASALIFRNTGLNLRRIDAVLDAAMAIPTIVELDFSDNPFGTAGVAWIATRLETGKLTHLKKLILKNVGDVSDTAEEQLRKAAEQNGTIIEGRPDVKDEL